MIIEILTALVGCKMISNAIERSSNRIAKSKDITYKHIGKKNTIIITNKNNVETTETTKES